MPNFSNLSWNIICPVCHKKLKHDKAVQYFTRLTCHNHYAISYSLASGSKLSECITLHPVRLENQHYLHQQDCQIFLINQEGYRNYIMRLNNPIPIDYNNLPQLKDTLSSLITFS